MTIRKDIEPEALVEEVAERRRRTVLHLAARSLMQRPYPYPRIGETLAEFAARAGIDADELLRALGRAIDLGGLS